MAKIKSCGFLIYRDRPRRSFLLMRHSNRWDLPKGHVDPGETKLQCAFRELEEETGIVQDDIRMDVSFKFQLNYVVNGKRYKPPRKKKLTIYLAELLRPVKIVPTEHEGFEWFEWGPPHELQEQTIDPLLDYLKDHWSSRLV